MLITPSAYKHGFNDEQIMHIWDNALRFVEHEHDGEERLLVIGPLPNGAIGEVVAVPVDGPSRIIHADFITVNHLDYLRGF